MQPPQEESYQPPKEFSSQPSEDTSIHEKVSAVLWSTAATLLLIKAYNDNKRDFSSSSKRKYKIWEDIASVLQESGHPVIVEMCDKKMRGLKNRYIIIKDNAELSGRGSDTQWPFYEAMDEVLCQSLRIGQPSTSAEPFENVELPVPSPSQSTSSRTISPAPSASSLPPPRSGKRRRSGEQEFPDKREHPLSALDELAGVAFERNAVLEKFMQSITNQHIQYLEHQLEADRKQEKYNEEMKQMQNRLVQLQEDRRRERQEDQAKMSRQYEQTQQQLTQMLHEYHKETQAIQQQMLQNQIEQHRLYATSHQQIIQLQQQFISLIEKVASK